MHTAEAPLAVKHKKMVITVISAIAGVAAVIARVHQ